MPMNPTKLKPIEIVRIVNTTPLMAVLNDRQLRRHRDRAGFRLVASLVTRPLGLHGLYGDIIEYDDGPPLDSSH